MEGAFSSVVLVQARDIEIMGLLWTTVFKLKLKDPRPGSRLEYLNFHQIYLLARLSWES